MSSYVSFFVRNNDNFIGLGDFSRNSVMYSYFNGPATYGKLRELGENLLLEASTYMKTELDNLQHERKSIEKVISQITNFNNSLEEKLSAIQDYQDMLTDIDNRVNEVEYCRSYCSFLIGVMDVNNGAYKLYFGEEVEGVFNEVIE